MLGNLRLKFIIYLTRLLRDSISNKDNQTKIFGVMNINSVNSKEEASRHSFIQLKKLLEKEINKNPIVRL